jgi:predicted phosphohydrolase
MRIHLLSDLHSEFGPFDAPAAPADVVILAGDTGVGLKGLSWAQEHFCGRTVIYIAGNHEYYGKAIPRHTEKLRDAAKTLGIYFLENESVVLDDVAYLGCTLWTDFALHGNVWLAASEAERLMTDYRRIRLSPGYGKLRANDTARLHRRSLEWLREEIPRHAGKKIVAVTHHAPSLRSVPDRFRNDPVSAAYASSLDDFVASSGVHTWVHGHVHDSADYMVGSTRVLCNPRGYPSEINESFQAGLVVEV